MGHQITIAIVDDDEAVRSGISRLLRSLGFTAISFSSAEEFLDSGQARASSCVVTDVRMPGMSGIELQQELSAQGLRVPVIFMSAFDEERTRTRAIGAGAREFLTKPFKEQVLIDTINAALQSS